ncbi:MAG: DMT family transporter [Anaerolineales bacterium]|nr:DMT family transporter [Anaerolineales bacterium]
MQSILFGLASALFWGAGDFAGGLVSRRVNAVRASLYVQAGGLIPVLAIALFTRQLNMPLVDWLWCSAAGVIGSLGFLALYRALADGQMSTAAPIAAVTSAGLPAIVGVVRDGVPSASIVAGFIFALAAIWLISQNGAGAIKLRLKDLLLPFLAGLGFGIYFIFVDLGGQSSIFAPLVAVRGAGGLTLMILAAFSKELHLPSRSMLPLVLLNISVDVLGSVFFILAVQSGRMDIAAVLGSLYSGVTVLLAWLILREKISSVQRIGVAIALLAIILITI